jgi:hypothetical protein
MSSRTFGRLAFQQVSTLPSAAFSTQLSAISFLSLLIADG